MKLLRSLEEILFEVISWLVFYPLTLWRILTRPLATMRYSDAELTAHSDDDTEYDAALSPPLLLLITVLLVNAVGQALHHQSLTASSHLMGLVEASPQNLMLFRGLVFSLIPLVAAVTLLRRQRVKLSRSTLKPPFFAQCYLAAPCAIVVGLGVAIFQRQDIPNVFGGVLMLAGTAWFLVTQTRWFRQELSLSWPRAAWTAVWALLRALFYLELLLIPLALF
ncbi:permease [Phenylobacterium immobile]|uniref:permease n=1 Tax=Phenylobacterium immobile TaxID=21 RepID=UPI00159EBA91|nr:permease [Phenylobacterium immobile]